MTVFEIDSAATSREEIGNPPHYGTKNKLYDGAYSSYSTPRETDDTRMIICTMTF